MSELVFQLPDDLMPLSPQKVLGDVGSEVVFTHDPDWDSGFNMAHYYKPPLVTRAEYVLLCL